MGYTEDYNELFYEVIEVLGETGDTTPRLDYFCRRGCEIFEADAMFIYGGDYPGVLPLKAGYCMDSMPKLPAEITARQIPDAAQVFKCGTLINVPMHNEINQIVGTVCLARAGENPLSREKMRDIVSIMLVIGYHLRMNLLIRKLEFSRASLESTLDNSGVGIYVTDFYTDEILYANKLIRKRFCKEDELVGKRCFEVIYDNQSTPCEYCPRLRLIDEHGNPTQKYSWDYLHHANNSWYRINSSAVNWLDGRLAHVIAATDITENKHSQLLVEQMAFMDSLTGIPNRRKFHLDFQESLNQAVSQNRPGYILFLDFDRFKQINDVFGHETGDALLRAIAQCIHEHPRYGRNVYRFGGDEFIIYVEDVDSDEIMRLTKELMERFSKPWELCGQELYCTASIGIACFPSDGLTVDELVKSADTAMYAAKKKGKNTTVVFSQDKAQDDSGKMKEYVLRKAIANGFGEFELLMDPVVEAKTGRRTGAEVLVRWNSAVYGVQELESFIPSCERMGLMGKLGEWVFRTAVTEMREYIRQSPSGFFIGINMSVMQIADTGFIDFVLNTLAEEGLPPGRIMFELSGMVDGTTMRSVADNVQKLRRGGVLMAIDNFGLGCSSLQMLAGSDFDMVKIDRTFVANCLNTKFERTFAMAAVKLAHAADAQICAEGAWNADISNFLTESGCDFLQGEHFSAPLPPVEFLKLIQLANRKL